ncbi:retropepsin-like aspartic protease, partial [Campylobacter jejuni]|uniref:retropepsin-like aspartic protease n=1 Tax=Campylobacter jejuni TaxID=197 RepID=UPI002F964FEB
AGALPMLCSPVISNVQVTKTLIDGGAGLNVMSVDTFDNLQVPYEQLQPTKPFSGVTDGSTTPIGQVRLPITFVEHTNYRTELIDFDVAH